MGTVHTVAVHFRYDHCMRRLANEFLCRNPHYSRMGVERRSNRSPIIVATIACLPVCGLLHCHAYPR